jgi:hypothetical protein
LFSKIRPWCLWSASPRILRRGPSAAPHPEALCRGLRLPCCSIWR